MTVCASVRIVIYGPLNSMTDSSFLQLMWLAFALAASSTGAPLRECLLIASASVARWAPAKPRCWKCYAKRCATGTTWRPSPTTSTPRKTGGCPHTAIREDASINLEAIDRMLVDFPDADIVFIESGGDNLAATFSPELSDLTIYVIDVAAGEKIPRKGGPGIAKSDLLVINKTDLAPYVMTNLKTLSGLNEVVAFIETKGILRPAADQ